MHEDDDREPDDIVKLWIIAVAHGASGAERKANPIDSVAWSQLVDADPTLSPTDHVMSRLETSGSLSTIPRMNSARWSGHPKGTRVTFSLRRGGVEVAMADPEDPDTDTTGFTTIDRDVEKKAAEIAIALGAQVFVRTVDIPVWRD